MTSTTAAGFPIRPSCCASKARAPRCSVTTRTRHTVAGKRNVGITSVEPVGHYAVRLIFDDGHASGIFAWDFLHRLGWEQETRWEDYLNALAAKGLHREP